MNDSEIVALIIEGEEQGLRLLMGKYLNYVTAILCNMAAEILTQEDIEEVAADVFLAVWNSRERLTTDRPLKPYLAKIARNAAISRLRKMKNAAIPFDDDIIVISREGNPDEAVVEKEQREIINHSVKAFKDPDREIFVRFYYMGEKIEIIGKKLGLNPSTVKTKLHRCRKHIKSIFEERGYCYEQTD